MTYSQYPDFYEYRTLVKENNSTEWKFGKFGPFIDKTED